MNDRNVKSIQCVGEYFSDRRRVNGSDEGEGIWLMDFIYIYEIEQQNFFHLL
jgi:hypothetical protein